jgi:hypothetical protein
LLVVDVAVCELRAVADTKTLQALKRLGKQLG